VRLTLLVLFPVPELVLELPLDDAVVVLELPDVELPVVVVVVPLLEEEPEEVEPDADADAEEPEVDGLAEETVLVLSIVNCLEKFTMSGFPSSTISKAYPLPATRLVEGVQRKEPVFWIFEAIVVTVLRSAVLPCLRIKLTVSVVPVDGAQVMLNGVPAVTVLRVVNVKGFCALAKATTAATRREVENCILTASLSS